MGDTYQNIQDDCLDYGYGEADRNRFKAWINDAYMDVFGRRRWSWAEGTTTLSLSAGASSASMPSMSSTPYQFGRIQKVTTPSSGFDRPEYVDYTDDDPISWVDNPVTIYGPPSQYSIWSGTVYFNRLADIAYAYQIIYWAEPTRMSANSDEPSIPDYAREILRWGALKRAKAREQDWPAHQQFQALEDKAYAQLVNADVHRSESRQAAMSPDYQGAYDYRERFRVY